MERFVSPRLGDPIKNAPDPTPGQGLTLDHAGAIPVTVPAQSLQILTADPVSPVVGQVWVRAGSLCVRSTATTTVKVALA